MWAIKKCNSPSLIYFKNFSISLSPKISIPLSIKRLAVVDGDVDNGSVMAGQVAAMVNEKADVKDILESFMRELEEEKNSLIARMNSWQ